MQRLLSLLSLAALGIALVGCATERQPGVTELEACFRQHPEPNRQTKDWQRVDNGRLTVCLRTVSESEQARLLQAFVRRGFEFRDPYLRKAYWAAVFPELVKAGRWNDLRLAFTVYSLNELAFNQPEWWIADRDVARLDVFCDAYRAAKDKDIRDQIVVMLRTAFFDQSFRFTDDQLIEAVDAEFFGTSYTVEVHPDYLVRFTSLNSLPVQVPLLRLKNEELEPVPETHND
jgi:hypothetical protein